MYHIYLNIFTALLCHQTARSDRELSVHGHLCCLQSYRTPLTKTRREISKFRTNMSKNLKCFHYNFYSPNRVPSWGSHFWIQKNLPTFQINCQKLHCRHSCPPLDELQWKTHSTANVPLWCRHNREAVQASSSVPPCGQSRLRSARVHPADETVLERTSGQEANVWWDLRPGRLVEIARTDTKTAQADQIFKWADEGQLIKETCTWWFISLMCKGTCTYLLYWLCKM